MNRRTTFGRHGGDAARRTFKLRIDTIAAGGEGVARDADGRVVFVHRTAPGELIEARIVAERSTWARGVMVRIRERSPARRDAPCPHYAECGGCTLEHLDYAAQLEAKRAIVHDALARIAHIDVDSLEIVPSPLETNYRNRVSFTLERAGPNRLIAGFNALHDPGRLIDVDGRCLLPEAPVSRVWDQLRAAWGPNANLLPDGKRLRLTLRASASGNVSLLIDGGDSPGHPDALLAAVAGLDAIWHRPRDRRPIHLAGARQMSEQWGDESIALGGAAFVQVNRTAAALLEQHVVDLIGAAAGRRIVDAYCGVGLHGRRLARCGADVVGIELDTDAVRVAQQAGLANLSILAARVEDVLAQALPADVLILNPPRAGVVPRVIEKIVAGTVGRIVYVSCDPATLARDIKRLAPRFRLTHVRAFDLFPQTAHVETVAVLDADSE